jgi:hypothetical protein
VSESSAKAIKTRHQLPPAAARRGHPVGGDVDCGGGLQHAGVAKLYLAGLDAASDAPGYAATVGAALGAAGMALQAPASAIRMAEPYILGVSTGRLWGAAGVGPGW